ncbi:telomerase reverse transcriptase-like [Liolophura sinensis]|uniref:telomerase reverse transcriptase-like n=1 Tax=Liolophura sinensis TaxID=3198878 RepID=UPI003158AE64
MDYDVERVFQVLQALYSEVWVLHDWLRLISAEGEGNPLVQAADSQNFKLLLSSTVVAFSANKKPPPKCQRVISCSHQRELLFRVVGRIKKQGRANKNVLTLGFGMISDDQNGRIGSLPDMEYQYPNSNFSQLHLSVWNKLLSRVGDAVMMYLLENASLFLHVPPSCYTQITGFPAHNLPCFDFRSRELCLKAPAHLSVKEKPRSSLCSGGSANTTEEQPEEMSEAKHAAKQLSRKRKRSIEDEKELFTIGKRRCFHQCVATKTCSGKISVVEQVTERKTSSGTCDVIVPEQCQTSKWKMRRGKKKRIQRHPPHEVTAASLKYNCNKTLNWARCLYRRDLREKWPKDHCMNFHSISKQAQTTKLFHSMFAEVLPPEKHSSALKGRNMTEVPQLDGQPPSENDQNYSTEEMRGETTADSGGLLAVLTKVKPHLEHIIANHRSCPFRPLLNQYCSISKMKRSCRCSSRVRNTNAPVSSTYQSISDVPHPTVENHDHVISDAGSSPAVSTVPHLCPQLFGTSTFCRTRCKLRKKRVRMSLLLGDHVHPRKVFLFLRQVCLRVIPKDLLGCQNNWNRFMNNIRSLLSMGRYDKIKLDHLLLRMKLNSVKWLPCVDHKSRVAILSSCVWWLFSNYVMVILKTYFYITDTTRFRNKLFFYRKAVWNRLKNQAQGAYLKTGMFSYVSGVKYVHYVNKAARRLVSEGQSLGVSSLRFLPKNASLRLIVNMGRSTGLSLNKSQKDLSVNAQLADVFQVLKFEKLRKPSIVGMSVFGVDDIYARWKYFILSRKNKNDGRPLYFVSVDVKDCYDSINQQKLFSIITGIIRQSDEEEYIIRRYVKVVSTSGKLKRLFCRDVTGLHDFQPDFLQYVRGISKGENCHRAVIVDQILHRHITPDEFLQKLAAHLFNNIIQMGPSYFHQKTGISQGSVISSLLCSMYFGSMEGRVISPDRDGEVMMRMVDDWLFVTPVKGRALSFLKTMNQGIPEYNCYINTEKTLTNFGVEEADCVASCIAKNAFVVSNLYLFSSFPVELFPWCGLLFDTDNLSVTVDYSRYPGLSIADTLTFDLTQSPGLTLKRKMFDSLRTRCQGLFVDQQINSLDVVVSNVYKIFLLLAFKFHAMVKKLPSRHRANDNPAFFHEIIVDLSPYFYYQTGQKMKRLDTDSSWCLTLNSLKWLCCEAFRNKLINHQSEYYLLLKTLRKEQKTLKMGLSQDEKTAVFDSLVSRFPPEFLDIQN